MKRPRSEYTDSILGREFEVGKLGFVRVVDYMGDDTSIVQAARVSYGDGTKTVSDDAALINYLMRHNHTSPFEMCEIKFHIKCPIYVWRQWIRHRTASVNELSARYSVVKPEFDTTNPTDWRLQSQTNKQGSSDLITDDADLEDCHLAEVTAVVAARQGYETLIDKGVAREQARKILPVSTYTEAYWKIDLHNLLHFLTLRLDEKAQLEIREFAEAIATIVQAWVPITYQAFANYRLYSIKFSSQECIVLRSLNKGDIHDARFFMQQHNLINRENRPTREGREFLAKLDTIGTANRDKLKAELKLD